MKKLDKKNIADPPLGMACLKSFLQWYGYRVKTVDANTEVNFNNMEIPEVKVHDLKLTPYRPESTAVKFDIKLMAQEWEDRLHCTLDYSTKLFKAETIIDKVVRDPAVKISDIRLMSEVEKKEIIEDFTEDLQYEF